MFGHDQKKCIVRDEPLLDSEMKEVTCLFCKEKGHVVCKEPHKIVGNDKDESNPIGSKDLNKKKSKKPKEKLKGKIDVIKLRSIMYRKQKNRHRKKN